MLALTLFALGAIIQAFITLQAVTGMRNACFLIAPAIVLLLIPFRSIDDRISALFLFILLFPSTHSNVKCALFLGI